MLHITLLLPKKYFKQPLYKLPSRWFVVQSVAFCPAVIRIILQSFYAPWLPSMWYR